MQSLNQASCNRHSSERGNDTPEPIIERLPCRVATVTTGCARPSSLSTDSLTLSAIFRLETRPGWSSVGSSGAVADNRLSMRIDDDDAGNGGVNAFAL